VKDRDKTPRITGVILIKRSQPVPTELAQKQKKPGPVVKGKLPPKGIKWSSARLQRWMGELLILVLFPASRLYASDEFDMGRLSCRASISITKFMKPTPQKGA
jgi:hypothetical protein